MASRTYTLHPIVTKLFVDAVLQLVPGLKALELPKALSTVQRVTNEEGYQLLEVALQLTGRPDLGVLAAQAAEPGHFDLVELASRAQCTLGEAIETLSPLWPMLQEGAELCLETHGPSSRLVLRLASGMAVHPAGYDFVLMSMVIAARRQTGIAELVPTRVFLPYALAPGQSLESLPLARVFGVPLVLEAPEFAWEFPSEVLALPLLRADASMGKALKDVAQDMLQRAAQEQRSKLESEVRERLQLALPQGNASAHAIARQLHMSERTLRRRLEAEGLSLRELTDQVRHELSLSLLANHEASTDEVAAQLGFTTAQAFHRAFRRWTGETVQGYRSRQRGA